MKTALPKPTSRIMTPSRLRVNSLLAEGVDGSSARVITRREPGPGWALHTPRPHPRFAVFRSTWRKIVDGGFSTEPTPTVFMEDGTEPTKAATWTRIRPVPTCPSSREAVEHPRQTSSSMSSKVRALGDDDAVKVNIPNGFSFCGHHYQSVWVNSNGNVTFGSGDTNPSATANGLRVGAPRICGVWDDLDPSTGWVIAAYQVGQNFQIRFLQVPEIFFGGLNTFTITLRPNATIRWTTAKRPRSSIRWRDAAPAWGSRPRSHRSQHRLATLERLDRVRRVFPG